LFDSALELSHLGVPDLLSSRYFKTSPEIIRSLIEKIVVSPRVQRGKSAVVLHGAFASILAYANDTAQSGAVSSSVGRVLLVAGVGFTQTPTIQKAI
jgi:hypothetical protein